MHDPLYPRIPSLRSVLTFGTIYNDAAPVVQSDVEQFTHAMEASGVTAIRNTFTEDPKE
jgi:hypothetical protein